jgi:hypothetical protein
VCINETQYNGTSPGSVIIVVTKDHKNSRKIMWKRIMYVLVQKEAF